MLVNLLAWNSPCFFFYCHYCGYPGARHSLSDDNIVSRDRTVGLTFPQLRIQLDCFTMRRKMLQCSQNVLRGSTFAALCSLLTHTPTLQQPQRLSLVPALTLAQSPHLLEWRRSHTGCSSAQLDSSYPLGFRSHSPSPFLSHALWPPCHVAVLSLVSAGLIPTALTTIWHSICLTYCIVYCLSPPV